MMMKQSSISTIQYLLSTRAKKFCLPENREQGLKSNIGNTLFWKKRGPERSGSLFTRDTQLRGGEPGGEWSGGR